MKKTLLHTLLLSLLIIIPTQVFGSECQNSCSIQSGPSEVISQYIRDTQDMLRRISGQVQNGEKLGKLKSNREYMRVYNSYVFNWDSYFNTFQYTLVLPLNSEVPSEIKRDHRLLENAIEYQNNFLDGLTRGQKLHIEVQDICGELANCDLGGPAGDVVGQILANTQSFLSAYRLAILGKREQVYDTEILFGENIASKILESYNPNTVSGCSSCKGNFKDRITTAIENIVQNERGYSRGIQEWRDAWALLTHKGVSAEEQKIKDRQAKTNGVFFNKKRIIDANTAKYDGADPFINNGAIQKASRQLSDTFSPAFDNFEETLDSVIPDLDNQVAIQSFAGTTQEVDKTNEIDTIISNLYTSLEAFAPAQDTASSSALGSIVSMHDSLTYILTELLNESTVKNSQKACNGQHRGEGNCS